MRLDGVDYAWCSSVIVLIVNKLCLEQGNNDQQRQQPPVGGKQLRNQSAEIDHIMLKPQGIFALASLRLHCDEPFSGEKTQPRFAAVIASFVFSGIELATHLIAPKKFGEFSVATRFTLPTASHYGGADMQFASEILNIGLRHDFRFVPVFSRN